MNISLFVATFLLFLKQLYCKMGVRLLVECLVWHFSWVNQTTHDIHINVLFIQKRCQKSDKGSTSLLLQETCGKTTNFKVEEILLLF